MSKCTLLVCFSQFRSYLRQQEKNSLTTSKWLSFGQFERKKIEKLPVQISVAETVNYQRHTLNAFFHCFAPTSEARKSQWNGRCSYTREVISFRYGKWTLLPCYVIPDIIMTIKVRLFDYLVVNMIITWLSMQIDALALVLRKQLCLIGKSR